MEYDDDNYDYDPNEGIDWDREAFYVMNAGDPDAVDYYNDDSNW